MTIAIKGNANSLSVAGISPQAVQQSTQGAAVGSVGATGSCPLNAEIL